MNKKRVNKNLSKIWDNIPIDRRDIKEYCDRIIIDISHIEEIYYKDIDNFILSLNDKKHITFNKMHKKIALQ